MQLKGIVTHRGESGQMTDAGTTPPTPAPAALRLQLTRWSIGGVRLRLASSDPELAIDLPRSLMPFLCGADPPDAIVTARWHTIDHVAESCRTFDSGGVWTLRRSARELLFEFRAPNFGVIPYKIARFRPDFSTGEVLLHRPYFPAARSMYPLEYPLDELLFTNLLARRGGVELHGCGIVDGDQGLLFLGFSGAGKSTMARLWRHRSDATVLSDDRIVLRLQDGHVQMYGTPWHGDEALIAPGPVALTRIFFLHQGSQREVRPLGASTAVASLFSCCFAPFHSGDGIAATLDTLDRVARAVPCDDLWFTPDAASVDFIRALR